jgi:O-antigen/teichoic acid export membrane protein
MPKVSTAKQLLKGSVTRVSQTLVSIIVAFFMMPFLIHELGDHWYGVWTVVGSLAAAYHLFDMGMASAVTRYVSHSFSLNDDDGANTTINTSVAIYLSIAAVIAILTVAVSFIARGFIEAESDKDIVQLLVLIIGTSVACEFPFNALAGIAQAKLRFHHVAITRIVVTLLGALLTWWFISQGHGVVTLAVIAFGTARLSNIIYFAICRSAFPNMTFSKKFISGSKGRELFGYSIWSFVIAIAHQLRNNVDSFVIAGFLSAATVPHYVIGQRLVDYIIQLLSQATNMFTPIFTGYHAQGNITELREKLLFITRINLVLVMIASSGMFIFGQAFISLWMGPDYAIAYWVMVILLTGRMLSVVNLTLTTTLYAVNRHRLLAKIEVVEVVMNLLLSLVLVQYFGIIGVAMGTMIPQLFLRIFVLPVYACRAIGIPVRDYFLCLARPLASVITPLAAIYYWIQTGPQVESYIEIMTYAVIMSVFTGIAGLKFGFSREQQSELRKLLPGKHLRALV